MKHLRNPKVVLAALATMVFFYLLFEWVAGAVVHSRKVVMVPDLKGKSLNEAMAVLAPFNLGLKKDDDQFDQTVPAGIIVRQSPLPGMSVREGKIVRITLSQGGEVTFVPVLIGQPVRSAEILIRSSGLSLGEESSRFSIVQEKGSIVAQDPVSGTIVEKDAMINMVISAGPPAEGVVLTPSFAGKAADEARAWAEKNRVEMEVLEEAGAVEAAGTVVRQEPEPDSDITLQKKVTLYVAGAQAGDGVPSEKKFHYEVPQGGEDRHLRLAIVDESGEKEVFRGVKAPGSKLEIPIAPKGKAKIRIYINNILVEERDVQ